jgi:predicted nucleotidyltransferase
MATPDILRDRRDEIFRIASGHGGRDLKVFGSWARGEARPGSDIDILLKLDPGRSLLDLIAIEQDLEDLLGCKVDVLTEASISPYIREQVLKDAVSI